MMGPLKGHLMEKQIKLIALNIRTISIKKATSIGMKERTNLAARSDAMMNEWKSRVRLITQPDHMENDAQFFMKTAPN